MGRLTNCHGACELGAVARDPDEEIIWASEDGTAYITISDEQPTEFTLWCYNIAVMPARPDYTSLQAYWQKEFKI